MPEIEQPEDLYGLRPEEFTAARDALARTLRSAGERDRAAEVKKLRRPSTIAWALNQVARADPSLIDAFLTAGSEVKDALERGDSTAMRDAERSMRGASDEVVEAAGQFLEGAGTGAGATGDARARLATTLRAALVDADVAERVRAGALDRDVEVAGFGLDDIAVAPPRSARVDKQEEEARRARAKVAELEAVAERLATRARRLSDRAAQAEDTAREARAEADRAQQEATEAAERASAASGGHGYAPRQSPTDGS